MSVRHLLGISGGKDSSALAIYMKDNHPAIPLEYYFCDTGKELKETYELLDALEAYLEQPIARLTASVSGNPFDVTLEKEKGYLPSALARWCTRKLKLKPFEKFVGKDPAISYVALREDENREGYISKKSNIQTVFPFKRNMWSREVIESVLRATQIDRLTEVYTKLGANDITVEIASSGLSEKNTNTIKMKKLLDCSIPLFNQAIFWFCKHLGYPMKDVEEEYSLLQNTGGIKLEDVYDLLNKSQIGLPKYYTPIEFEVDNQKSTYYRSRSGCFFCFFQQKIEWIWLYEQHPALFKEAMAYEKEDFKWSPNESLSEMIRPERVADIKRRHLKKMQQRQLNALQGKLFNDEKTEGRECFSCFL